MTAVSSESARINLRTSPEAKALIERAVVIMGSTVSSFMLQNAYEAARRLEAEQEVMTLSDRDAYAINAGTVVAVPVNEAQFKQRSLQVLTLTSSPAESQSSQFVAHLTNTALAMA